MPRDAETWLAARGIRREPLRVVDSGPSDTPVATPDRPSGHADDAGHDEARSVREPTPPSDGPLPDDLAAAVAFIRRSVAGAPQSEMRLAGKLADRGLDHSTVEAALSIARSERLVDDAAMVQALVDERRRRGHAAARIRRDLVDRGYPPALVDVHLAPVEALDAEAMAFDVARQRAEQLTGLEAQAAYRRVLGYVARRGYPDGLARKVARAAVFASRERQQAAGH